MMPKKLTSLDVAHLIAERTGLNIEDVKKVLQAQAELAYTNASLGFSVPGIGVLRYIEHPERIGTNPFGPNKGEKIKFRAKKNLKFLLSRLASVSARDHTRPVPDLFDQSLMQQFTFSTQAVELSDPSLFTSDLGDHFNDVKTGQPVPIAFIRLTDLRLPTGRIAASDGLIGGAMPFNRAVAPGTYPIALGVAQIGSDQRVALAVVRFSKKKIARWEITLPERDEDAPLRSGEPVGYGVDSGTGSFYDPAIQTLIEQTYELDLGFHEHVTEEMRKVYKNTRDWVHIESPEGSKVIFSSGYGDGQYPSYFGLDDTGDVASLVTDFKIIKWAATSL